MDFYKKKDQQFFNKIKSLMHKMIGLFTLLSLTGIFEIYNFD